MSSFRERRGRLRSLWRDGEEVHNLDTDRLLQGKVEFTIGVYGAPHFFDYVVTADRKEKFLIQQVLGTMECCLIFLCACH